MLHVPAGALLPACAVSGRLPRQQVRRPAAQGCRPAAPASGRQGSQDLEHERSSC